MALAPSAMSEREGAPHNLNFASNNPFRNRANSPALPSPSGLTAPVGRPPRPISTNPFLAPFESNTGKQNTSSSNIWQTSNMTTGGGVRPASPKKTDALGDSLELSSKLFDNLSVKDRSAAKGAEFGGPKRSDTFPEQRRPSRSEEDQRGARPSMTGRRPSRPRIPPSIADPFASPERRPNRPRRTNSESSSHGPLTEAERKERDLRRRQRESRYRMGERDKDGKPRSRTRKAHGLDIIDKLDVTGIYGSGLFHHDGPFDACTPHRNRRRDTRAPMQAFPANSANNLIGGSGPVNMRIDLDRIRGVGPEGYSDYSSTGTVLPRKSSFDQIQRAIDPYSKTDVVHGEESFGLGTSTFLEGTPASRKDIQRHNSDNNTATLSSTANGAGAGGLVRKKSLAMRLRGMSAPRRPPDDTLPTGAAGGPPLPTSPDSPPRKGLIISPPPASSRAALLGPQSAGGRLGQSGVGDANPFFNDYDDAYEKKGVTIRAKEVESGLDKADGKAAKEGRDAESPLAGMDWPLASSASENPPALLAPPPPVPAHALPAGEAATNGAAGSGATSTAGGASGGGGGGGLLGRMKSLKVKKSKAAV